jgi:hypothetical protein
MGPSGKCIWGFHRTFRWLPSSAGRRRRVQAMPPLDRPIRVADDDEVQEVKAEQLGALNVRICSVRSGYVTVRVRSGQQKAKARNSPDSRPPPAFGE